MSRTRTKVIAVGAVAAAVVSAPTLAFAGSPGHDPKYDKYDGKYEKHDASYDKYADKYAAKVGYTVRVTYRDDPRSARNAVRDAKVGRLQVIGLVGDNTLVRFLSDKPGRTQKLGMVTGLEHKDVKLVGIDYRVQNGLLYGVGRGGGVYTIDTVSLKATKVLNLTVALEGDTFGVDFNPAANALRITSNTGQNLRQSFAMVAPATTFAATAVDGRLNTPVVPTATATATATATVGVDAVAYTNNDLDADTGTVLKTINFSSDSLNLQSPANAGTQALIGALKVDAGSDNGFDIFSYLEDGAAVEVKGYATLAVGGQRGFYKINLTNGRATLVGRLGDAVTDIAIPLAR